MLLVACVLALLAFMLVVVGIELLIQIAHSKFTARKLMKHYEDSVKETETVYAQFMTRLTTI